jgi:hypothetical protein
MSVKIQPSVQFKVPVKQLREHLPESVLLIRLGAVANAMLSAAEGLPSDDSSLANIRARVHATALFASLAIEAAEILRDDASGIVWKLVEQGLGSGGSLPTISLAELRGFVTWGSPFLNTCAHIRDRHLFHVDDGPARGWIKNLPRQNVILQTVEGADFSTCLFDASANLVRSSLPSKQVDSGFADRLWQVAVAFPCLVHAAIRGFGTVPGVTLTAQPESPAPLWNIYLRPLTEQGMASRVAVEIRPRVTTWSPFFVAIPARDVEALKPTLRVRSAQGMARSVEMEPSESHV